MTKEGKSRKKGCLKIVGIGVVLLIGLFVLFAYLGGKDFDQRVAVAEAFFKQIQKKDLKAAYDMTAREFRDRVTLEAMESMLVRRGLLDYSSAEWDRADSGPAGESAIRGVIKLKNSGAALLRLTFAEEGETIRVLDLTDPLPDMEDESPKVDAADETTDDSGGEKRIGFSFTTAKFKNVRLAREDKAGAESVTEFPRNIKQIYCLADVAWAPSKTKLSAEWFYLGKAGDESPPQSIGRFDVFTDASSTNARFELERARERFFPAGMYRVRLYIDDKERQTLDFTVRDPTAPELLQMAEAGDFEAQFGLFSYYLMEKAGNLTEQDAIGWLRKAAEGDYVPAQYNLGAIYFKGRHGIAQDYSTAVKWFRRAAKEGDPDSAHHLAVCYRDGLGLDKSMTEAIVWTRKAAEYGSAEAQYNMGVHYNMGIGLPKDADEAGKWLRKSADQGFEPARKALTQLEKSN